MQEPAGKHERVVVEVMSQFHVDLTTDKCESIFHVAAERGYIVFTKLALGKGFTSLLSNKNTNNELPVQVCLAKKQFGMAALMLNHMAIRFAHHEDSIATFLFAFHYHTEHFAFQRVQIHQSSISESYLKI